MLKRLPQPHDRNVIVKIESIMFSESPKPADSSETAKVEIQVYLRGDNAQYIEVEESVTFVPQDQTIDHIVRQALSNFETKLKAILEELDEMMD